MMQKTKIFVSAESEGVKSYIPGLTDFFRRINDCYLDRDRYFSLLLEDDLGDGASREVDIPGCALAFFLTDGGAPSESYKAALDFYSKTGKPRIVVYVKSQENESSETALYPYSHTTNYYTHLDTLKLGILMQIGQLGLDGVDIKLSDGKAWQGGDALMALNNVEAISGYENLQNLKSGIEDLENRYIEAKVRYTENPDDEAAYKAFVEAAKLRGEAIAEINSVELQLYHMIEGMYEHTEKGKLSKRQSEAYRLAERGLIGEARDVLDFYAIVNDSRSDEERAEQLSQRAQVHVNELLQLKDLNAALLDWEGVETCYKEAVRLEEKHNLPRQAEVDYALHLVTQFKYDQALIECQKLMRYFDSLGDAAPVRDKSRAFTLLGWIYAGLAKEEEAEATMKAGLEMLRAMDGGDRDYVDRSIGTIYHNMGLLYDNCLRFSDAVEAYEHALDIRVGLAGRNTGEDEEHLATTYLNLGHAYNSLGKYEAALENSLKARDILIKVAKVTPEPNEGYLTICISNLCESYLVLERFDEAEEQLAMAIKINKRLAEQNPETYELYLANTFHGYGSLFRKTKNYAQAEEKYIEAIKTLKRRAVQSPEYIEPLIAIVYSDLGGVYADTGRIGEAESAFQAALKLHGKYAENPACAENAGKTQKALDDLKAKQLRESPRGEGDPRGMRHTELTQEEREVALLLTDGLTKRDIARKLHIDADIVATHEKEIRKKLNMMSEDDPVIAAITAEFNLTKREADTLRCLRDSASNEEIASKLVLSAETVRIHVRNVIRKLPVDKREGVREWVEAYRIIAENPRHCP